MQIRLNSPVCSSDGPFGEVADVIVDARAPTVTHLVVEPHHQHWQARLVPMTLVQVRDDAVVVLADEQHVRALQRVADNDFVRLGESVDLGPGWFR